MLIQKFCFPRHTYITTFASRDFCCTNCQSSIEETLQRIKSTEGVQGFVIVDQNGGILRKSDSFTDEVSTQSGALVDDLTRMAMSAVRDLDAKVRLLTWTSTLTSSLFEANSTCGYFVLCIVEQVRIPSLAIRETRNFGGSTRSFHGDCLPRVVASRELIPCWSRTCIINLICILYSTACYRPTFPSLMAKEKETSNELVGAQGQLNPAKPICWHLPWIRDRVCCEGLCETQHRIDRLL